MDATSYLDLLVGGDDAALRQCDMNHLYSEDLECSHSSSSRDAVVKEQGCYATLCFIELMTVETVHLERNRR